MYKLADKNYSMNIPDFVLSCLNGKIKENEIKMLTGKDWLLIDEVARRKVITTFIFYKFKERDLLRFLPQAIRDTWQQHFYNNLKHNEIILRELSNILNKLKDSDIEVILLKGTSLLVDGYANSGLRPMGDADILIKSRDIFRATQALKEAGLNLKSHRSSVLAGGFDADLMFANNNLVLEAFPNLYQYERFKGILWSKQNDIWGNSRLVNLEDQQFRILSSKDQILHLCQHICIEHLLNNVVHFLDIRELIGHHKNSLNWVELLDEARKQNLSSCLYYALLFTKKFFCADIPDWVLEELKPLWPKRIFINLFIDKNYIFSVGNILGIKRYVLQSLFMDKSLDSFKVAWRGLFPSKEWFLYRYGRKALRKFYLYRIMHPFKILFG